MCQRCCLFCLSWLRLITGGDAAAALSRLSLKEPTTLHGADHSSVSAVTAAAAIGNASDGIAGRSVDLSKLSMQQLERLKERAREKQWEDEWWRMFVKKEAEKRARDAASSRSRERESIAAHNISLTKCVDCMCRAVFA
jgi:hypothetical protein